MHGNWNYDMHDGIGWGLVPMAIMMLLVWGSLIWFAVVLLRRTDSHEHAAVTGPPSAPPNPQQILAERLRTRLDTLTATRH